MTYEIPDVPTSEKQGPFSRLVNNPVPLAVMSLSVVARVSYFGASVGLRNGLKTPLAVILETTSSASLIILSITSLTVGTS